MLALVRGLVRAGARRKGPCSPARARVRLLEVARGPIRGGLGRDVYATHAAAPVAGACVRTRVQSMDTDPMAFTITSDTGAAVEGRVLVRWVGDTSWGNDPWALVGAPKSMITASGDAWSDFVLVEGDGGVSLIIAPEGFIRANNLVEAFGWHTVVCRMINGAVIVNSIEKRSSTPDWVSRMALSEACV
jgi:hypothetical protein